MTIDEALKTLKKEIAFILEYQESLKNMFNAIDALIMELTSIKKENHNFRIAQKRASEKSDQKYKASISQTHTSKESEEPTIV